MSCIIIQLPGMASGRICTLKPRLCDVVIYNSVTFCRSHEGGSQDKIVTNHDEESHARKQTYDVDRAKIRDTLTTFINPLDTSSHPSCIVNIASGLLAPRNVNVDYLATIGTRQMPEYEYAWWPHNFHRALDQWILTMAVYKNA